MFLQRQTGAGIFGCDGCLDAIQRVKWTRAQGVFYVQQSTDFDKSVQCFTSALETVAFSSQLTVAW